MSVTTGRPRNAARELADSTTPPELSFRRMGLLVLRALPFMRPMLKHVVATLALGTLTGFIYALAITLATDLFSNKVLVGT